MGDRLFELDDYPEVPIFKEPRRSRGEHDARFRNDYPPDWSSCVLCGGDGLDYITLPPSGICPRCLGMGSAKARVRLEAGHRCLRCLHPYIPKGDAKMLGVEPSGGRWSRCDARCRHYGGGYDVRFRMSDDEEWDSGVDGDAGEFVRDGFVTEAEWRILTVHHLSGDKSDCRWGNLAALCQRCHLEIQAKVVLERVYPHEHSEWFKPHAAWWYALAYLDEDLTREAVMDRLDELLALERTV